MLLLNLWAKEVRLPVSQALNGKYKKYIIIMKGEKQSKRCLLAFCGRLIIQCSFTKKARLFFPRHLKTLACCFFVPSG